MTYLCSPTNLNIGLSESDYNKTVILKKRDKSGEMNKVQESIINDKENF